MFINCLMLSISFRFSEPQFPHQYLMGNMGLFACFHNLHCVHIQYMKVAGI